MLKKYVYSAVLAAAMTSAPALAAVTITPATEWSVAPIAGASDNGLRFCSAKTSYRNGQAIVFARDNQGGNSIAIDFKRDAFTVGQSYTADLRVGKTSRRLSALASSPQILVLQTGIDTALYAVLHNRHAMKLVIDGNTYDYNLDVSFADALAALGQCADSFKDTATFTPTVLPLGKSQQDPVAELDESEPELAAAAQAPAPRKKKGAKQKTTKDSSGEVAALRAENERLQAEIRQQALRQDLQREAAVAAARQRPVIAAFTPSAPVPLAPVPEYAPARLRALLLGSKAVPAATLKPADDQGVLRWTDGTVNGAAQTELLKDFNTQAQAYLANLKGLCKGSFAQRASAPRKAGRSEVIEADVSCIDGKNDAGAAILFIREGGRFISITQESGIDEMDAAMLVRDAISASVN